LQLLQQNLLIFGQTPPNLAKPTKFFNNIRAPSLLIIFAVNPHSISMREKMISN